MPEAKSLESVSPHCSAKWTDRDAIARWPSPAYVCKQASSYDRLQTNPADAKTWFANKDYEQFIRVENRDGRREWVIMEHQGPGCITRFWVPLHGPRKNQTIRFYFDGSSTPGIAVKFNELLSGRSFVKPPLAFVASDEKSPRRRGRRSCICPFRSPRAARSRSTNCPSTMPSIIGLRARHQGEDLYHGRLRGRPRRCETQGGDP